MKRNMLIWRRAGCELPGSFLRADRKINRSLSCICWVCAVAFCVSSAVAQTDSEVRDIVQQIDQLRDAGKFQEAVPIAEKVLKYCEKNDGPDHPETATA